MIATTARPPNAPRRRGLFGIVNGMEMSNAVLVVVDVQNGFITRHSKAVVGVIADVVASWKAAGGDVWFSRYANYPGSPFERFLRWNRVQASPEIDIVEELREAATGAVVLDKTIYSVFDEAGRDLAKARRWTEFVFCGIATESCVLKSAVDAFELGYTPWLVHDACASDAGPTAHDAGLVVARRSIGEGQVIGVADLGLNG